jgi:glycosyltransferase involved in cell wall biosynthesis
MLGQTLEYFLGMHVPEGVTWELLVVNNNCTDNTDEVVRAYADRLPLVLCHEPRPGKSNACNHAITRAEGEFILWTDDDVKVGPTWLAATLQAFDDYHADMVFGKVLPWWETAPPSWYSKLFNGWFALLDYGPAPFAVTERRHLPFGVNMALRREVFQKLGGFTTEVGMLKNTGGGCEDQELFFRVMDRGLRVAYTPHAVIHHFIPRARCTKRFYRSRAWLGSHNHLHMLQQEGAGHPRLWGMPRYYVRTNLGYLWNYLGELLGGDRSAAFFYELKVIRFLGLLREAMRRTAAPAARAVGGLASA